VTKPLPLFSWVSEFPGYRRTRKKRSDEWFEERDAAATARGIGCRIDFGRATGSTLARMAKNQ